LLKIYLPSCVALALLSTTPSIAAPDLHGWVGTWTRSKNNFIRLSMRNGRIYAEGEASFGNPQSPNIGEFKGSSLPRNGRLTIRQRYNGELMCEVIMVHSGDNLTVLNHDPNCGGNGVSFRGSYHQQRRHR